jgi:predicted nuclease with TOPRIM domain
MSLESRVKSLENKITFLEVENSYLEQRLNKMEYQNKQFRFHLGIYDTDHDFGEPTEIGQIDE